MKLRTRQLTLAALTAAAYAVLSYFGSIFGITYGPIQCRFSEALCVLPFFLPETAWGLGVGCLIANLLSPYGVLDIVVGSAATLLAALLTARCKKMWLAPLPPVLANTVLIGLVLAYEQAGTSAAFWPTYAFNALTVGLGEAVADVLMGKVSCKFRKIGVNDQFGQSGKAADVLREYGLTADQIAAKIKEIL